MVTGSDLVESIRYYNGLGMPLQEVSYQLSPSLKDMIQPLEYDNQLREAIKYEAYTGTATGYYRSSWKTDQSAFYTGIFQSTDGSKAFSVSMFEASPLNRVIKQGFPGASWQPNTGSTTRQSSEHIISYQLGMNKNDATEAIYYWTITSNAGIVTFQRNTYNANSLSKVISKDENGNSVSEFKDLSGKVVMKQDAINGKTYYIYDDFDLLRCVMPPLASVTLAASSKTSFLSSEEDFKELCYYYEYDGRGRMIKKNLPGTIGSYVMTYDNLDRSIRTTDPTGK